MTERKRALIRRRHAVALDVLLLGASFWAAYLLRFEFAVPGDIARIAARQMGFVVAGQIIASWVFGIYSIVGRYVSLANLRNFASAALVSAAPMLVIRFAAGWGPARVPLSVIAMSTVFGFGSLFMVRVIDRLRQESARVSESAKTMGSLVLGVGKRSEQVVRHVLAHPNLGIDLVGFVDDDPAMTGMRIHGFPVLGQIDSIPNLARMHDIGQLVVATPLEADEGHRVAALCRAAGVRVLSSRKLYRHAISEAQGEQDRPRLFDGSSGFVFRGGRFIRKIRRQAVTSVLTDSVVLFAAFWLALYLRLDFRVPKPAAEWALIQMFLVWGSQLIVASAFGFYNWVRSETPVSKIGRVVGASVFAACPMLILRFVLPGSVWAVPVSVILMANLLGFGGMIAIRTLDHARITGFEQPASSHGLYRRFGKRLLDLTLVALTAPIFLPLLAVVALLVRARLGTPVLYRQARAGYGGRSFILVKFRTMVDVPHESPNSLSDELRLTPLGSWLRRFSLDELPEVWNVIRGDMSLVGPRPLLAQYRRRYRPVELKRLGVRPGLTGLAEVAGRNALGWERRFQLDVDYVENVSLWRDFDILWKTPRAVLTGRGVSAPGHATMPEFEAS
jgi:lipopolysaccharide/colanic/teichoic acid biosynthesis glycosyltransferase